MQLSPFVYMIQFFDSSISVQQEQSYEDDLLASEEVAQSNAFFVAMRGLLESPKVTRRRYSSYSAWSSNTSISTLDDDDTDRWSSADVTPSSSPRVN